MNHLTVIRKILLLLLTALFLATGGRADTTYHYSDGTSSTSGATSIGMNAWDTSKTLVRATLGTQVTDIGFLAFYGASSLVSITIPDTVTNINGYAFYECASLTGISLPNGLTSIRDSTFYGCTSLASVIFGKYFME